MKTINITAGQMLNDMLEEQRMGYFIPFNECFIEGGYTRPFFTKEFNKHRAKVHGVSVYEYESKLVGLFLFLTKANEYDEVILWFGDEPFCKANVKVLKEILTEFEYKGKITLNTVNEDTGEILNTETVKI